MFEQTHGRARIRMWREEEEGSFVEVVVTGDRYADYTDVESLLRVYGITLDVDSFERAYFDEDPVDGLEISIPTSPRTPAVDRILALIDGE